MSPSGIRFRPPEDAISPEIRWTLLRAFGPPNAGYRDEIEADEALRLVRLFEISSRVAARQSASLLERELGSETASQLSEDRRASVFSHLQKIASAHQLARTATGLGIRLVFLKFAALHFSGVIEPGSREASDIDVLAPRDRAQDLNHALCEAGYTPRDTSSSEHHLPILDHPKHSSLEIHRFIPGVQIPGSRSFATVDSLMAGGLLTRAAHIPRECWLPALEIQIAHTLVHGIAQHGQHPDAYSPARMIADLIDLGNAAQNRAEAFAHAQTIVRDAVSPEETRATRDLCESLRLGELPWSEALGQQEPAGILLRHVLFGLLNQDYRHALTLSLFNFALTERQPAVTIAVRLKESLFPSRGQIDKIYGPPKTRAGYMARRLWRPFSLLGRLVRYGGSYLKLRRTRHH